MGKNLDMCDVENFPLEKIPDCTLSDKQQGSAMMLTEEKFKEMGYTILSA